MKFEIPSPDVFQTSFEVIKTSAPTGEARLNVQVIALLAARGVPEDTLESVAVAAAQRLAAALSAGVDEENASEKVLEAALAEGILSRKLDMQGDASQKLAALLAAGGKLAGTPVHSSITPPTVVKPAPTQLVRRVKPLATNT